MPVDCSRFGSVETQTPPPGDRQRIWYNSSSWWCFMLIIVWHVLLFTVWITADTQGRVDALYINSVQCEANWRRTGCWAFADKTRYVSALSSWCIFISWYIAPWIQTDCSPKTRAGDGSLESLQLNFRLPVTYLVSNSGLFFSYGRSSLTTVRSHWFSRFHFNFY